jgi:hypothetical protein
MLQQKKTTFLFRFFWVFAKFYFQRKKFSYLEKFREIKSPAKRQTGRHAGKQTEIKAGKQ